MSRKKQIKHKRKKHMDASKVTVGAKTYDLSYLTGKKKTNLRRKLIVEFIESKPAGTTIQMKEFMDVGRFSMLPNTDTFIKRMIRDGVLNRWEGDKPFTYYYAVIGKARQITPPTHTETPQVESGEYDFTKAIKNLKASGLKFTITIESK